MACWEKTNESQNYVGYTLNECKTETPAQRLARLEGQQKQIADEIGEVKRNIEAAAKPKPEPSAQAMSAANRAVDELVARFRVKPPTMDRGLFRYTFETRGDEFAPAIAPFIDAEIARAKQEQREADAKIATERGRACDEQNLYGAGCRASAEIIARIIRNQQ